MLLILIVLLAAAPVYSQGNSSYLPELRRRASELSLERDPEWRRLLHHRWTLTGWRSEAAPGVFFLSPRGLQDPAAELEATLEAFFAPADKPDAQAQCRFPARYAWLKSRLAFDPAKLPEAGCPLYAQWRQMLSVDSVSMVFADAYLNNPSSMYGHTFLLLHKDGRKGLLDYAVNFSAEANTNNGALFAVYGLTGFFPGKFSVMPYYLKVQEYNSFESRDLWEYRLSLSSAAIDRMMSHLWELTDVSFDYYFFNKNCSYQLLPLLDVAEPGLGLADRWPMYVVPIDTVRQVQSAAGLVSQVSYRPSHTTRLLSGRGELTPAEIRAAERLARSDEGAASLESFAPERRALVLDTASQHLESLIDYRRDADPKLPERQHAVHRALGKLGIVVPPRDPAVPAPPDRGHPSSRVGLGFGALDGRGFEELSFRFALHDPLDPPEGYIPWSMLEMFQLRLRHQREPNRVYVESFDFVRILSLTPLDPWVRKPSWQVDAGMRQASELGGKPWNSPYFGLTLGSGMTLKVPRTPAAVYALAQIDAGAGPVFDDDHRLGPGGTAGIYLQAARRLRLNAEGSHWRYILGDDRSRGRARFEADFSLRKSLAARLRLQRHGSVDEYRAELHYYF